MKRFLCFILTIISLILIGCDLFLYDLDITNGNSLIIEVGESVQLNIDDFKFEDDVVWESNNSCVIVDDDGVITGISEGTGTVIVSYNQYSDSIIIEVVDLNEVELILSASKETLTIGESADLYLTINPISYDISNAIFEINSGSENATLNENTITGISVGTIVVVAKLDIYTSNFLFIEIVEEEMTIDPYVNVTKEEFYSNYTEASSYMDAYYRTKHGFMSGSIEQQDQEPTIANDRPMINDKYVKNSDMHYSSDGNTYYVVNGVGDVVNKIYKGAAYATLEDVAAYVFAFGDIPANYLSKKSGSPQNSIWGEYLRLNHSKFSGSTYKYPYEPELPNINGCGGNLQYYEIDLGTTGTDCDLSYDIVDYNNGYKITRGAARIVYSRYDESGKTITDISDKYLFYTYNHYNDFQEYLNYEGGWGEMFGNITGGGVLSSNYDYNPTPYIETILKEIRQDNSIFFASANNTTLSNLYYYYKKEEYIL